MNKRNKRPTLFLIVIIIVLGVLTYFADTYGFIENLVGRDTIGYDATTSTNLDNIPEYSGEPYVYLNDTGLFSESESWELGYEEYSSDDLGRCGEAEALVGIETMPTEDREDISSVEPTGWVNNKYDSEIVEGGWVYNRCHLLGFQLTGENNNPENLITGTRYLNIEGMLPFENEVAEYVKDTSNHVMYAVSPVYWESDMVANGVLMKAFSVEDSGAGINFDVYCYNVQPGIKIDYKTGNNWLN